jgi:hypothetical protein
MVTLVLLVGLSEEINASQVIRFGSPFYAPLTFLGLMLVGVGLVRSSRQTGNRGARSTLAP